jgi:hypothetical protein
VWHDAAGVVVPTEPLEEEPAPDDPPLDVPLVDPCCAGGSVGSEGIRPPHAPAGTARKKRNAT